MKKIIILTLLVFWCGVAFCQTPLFRYYNPQIKKHYYTINFNEFGNGGNGWNFEGVACQVYPPDFGQPDIAPVFRFFNPQSGDHYYTTGKFITRRDLFGYRPEGPVFSVYKHRAPGLRPLLEYYNPQSGDHFYTTNKHELERGFDGYILDNIVGFAQPR